MSADYRIQQDLNELQTMVDGLEEYVRGTALYGTTGGFLNRMPSLTVGAVIMRLRRLGLLSDQLDVRQQATLRTVQEQHDRILNEWHHHYTEKAERESHSRLDAMRDFFRECSDSPRQCPNIYPPEVLRRTIVQELRAVCPDLGFDCDKLDEKLRATDAQLRSIVQPASFIWSDILKPVYPMDDYWWLYHTPPAITS